MAPAHRFRIGPYKIPAPRVPPLTLPTPMIPRSLPRLAAAAVLALSAMASPAAAQAQRDPAVVVTTLYRDHFAHGQDWTGTFRRQRALFAPSLVAMLDADDHAAAANADEIVGLDFDPLTNAQDTMDGFTVGTATRSGATAVVPVTVRQGTARTRLRVRLARVGTSWRITNVVYPEGDLVSILRQLAADRKSS